MKEKIEQAKQQRLPEQIAYIPSEGALAGLGKVNQDLIRDWKPVKLIEWHREKARTIERVHEGMKNDLAAGVLPSKYFGANAAWRRLAVIAYHVLTALKHLALPAGLLTARTKRLRFLIFHTPVGWCSMLVS